MDILVVVGTCLKQNSSANLCHCSYINGMLELGHNVDLVCMSEDDVNIDRSMLIPNVDNLFTYYGLSFYERMSKKKRENTDVVPVPKVESTQKNTNKNALHSAIIKAKSLVMSFYGVYSITKSWANRAVKFKSDKKYNIVVSIAYPPVSHFVVKRLIDRRNIKYDKWIQIWEDPWSSDIVINKSDNMKIKKAEEELVSYPDKVVYVSPLTLEYQKNMYPKYANKMLWFPLPSYYISETTDIDISSGKIYGYFGDYAPSVRNLKPFYNVAVSENLNVNICGNPYGIFEKSSTVNIYPRLTLDKLKPIEDSTNVLVFLCNLQGGQIPGKIYQYAASNKIILFILDGTDEEKKVLKEYFGKYNRFIFCDNDEKSIKKAICRIESNDFKSVSNKPLNCFSPESIINDVLSCVKE